MKKFLLVISFSLWNINLLAQAPDTIWTKTYGGSGSDGAHGIVEVNDGFIITGNYGDWPNEVWISKINEDGNALWNKNYNGMGAGAILKLSENEFLVSAETFTQGSWENMMIMKIDNDGDTIWTKTFLYPGSEYTPVIKKSNDNNIFLLGYTDNISPSGTILMKLLENGDTSWTKFYPDIRGKDFEFDDEGGYIFLHNESSSTYISKIDLSGNLLLDKMIYDYPYSGSGASILKTADGDYLVLGTCQTNWDSSYIWIYKLNSALDSVWLKIYFSDAYERADYIIKSGIGGYLIIGTSGQYLLEDGLIIKIDEAGNLLWRQTFGGENNDQFYDISVTSDKGFIIAGATESFGADNFDVWLLRFESETANEILLDKSIPDNYFLSQNFPNPFNPGTIMKYSIPKSSVVVIKVFDILGEEIEALVKEEKPAGTYEVNWNAANLPSGVYFYQLRAGDFIQTKKMILLK